MLSYITSRITLYRSDLPSWLAKKKKGERKFSVNQGSANSKNVCDLATTTSCQSLLQHPTPPSTVQMAVILVSHLPSTIFAYPLH